MPRFPKLYGKGSLKRTLIGVGIVAVAFAAFYAWQPWRYDLVERKPKKPLPRIPIEETGLFEPGKRIAIVTAHPDDEAFYLGGTLYKLKEVDNESALILFTDGDKGYYPFFDSDPLRKTRQRETRTSAEKVGIDDVVFFGFPDGRLSFGPKQIDRLAEELKRRGPDIVLANDPYYWPRASHRDHRVSGEIAQAALEKIGFTGWVLYFQTVAGNTYVDVDKTWSQAQELLGVHASQFHGEKLRMIQGIVAEHAINAGQEFGTGGFVEPLRAVRYQGGKVVGNEGTHRTERT